MKTTRDKIEEGQELLEKMKTENASNDVIINQLKKVSSLMKQEMSERGLVVRTFNFGSKTR